MVVVIYARYSSDNQHDTSIDAQIRACTDYCKHNNYIIADTYIDQAFSATTSKRPAFQKLIHDSHSARFQGIVVHKLDRFSRNRYDSAFFKKKLKENNVKVISVLEHLDDTPESIILESVLEGLNEYYSANLSRETMKGQHEAALECKHLGGFVPFGYDIDNSRKYIINQREAEAVRSIFTKYLNGESYTTIIDWLNLNGFITRRKEVFGKNSLNSILQNEKYLGIYKYKEIKIADGVPQIINMELWEGVKKKMIANKNKGARHRAKNLYLLSGLIKCGKCGHPMSGATRKSGNRNSIYSDYQCTYKKNRKKCDASGIKKSYVENYVIDRIKQTFFNESFVQILTDKIFENNKIQLDSSSFEYDLVEKEIKDIDKKINNLIETIANGMYHESMKQKLTDLETRKKVLVLKLDQLRVKKEIKFTKKQIKEKILKDKTVKWDNKQKQHFIKTFVKSVIVNGKDTIELQLFVNKSGCGGVQPLLVTYTNNNYKLEFKHV